MNSPPYPHSELSEQTDTCDFGFWHARGGAPGLLSPILGRSGVMASQNGTLGSGVPKWDARGWWSPRMGRRGCVESQNGTSEVCGVPKWDAQSNFQWCFVEGLLMHSFQPSPVGAESGCIISSEDSNLSTLVNVLVYDTWLTSRICQGFTQS